MATKMTNKKAKSVFDRPIINWNVDTLDWKYHNSKKIANRVILDVDDGDIILMHDIYRATANSLEIIIPKLLEDGYAYESGGNVYFDISKLENGNANKKAAVFCLGTTPTGKFTKKW